MTDKEIIKFAKEQLLIFGEDSKMAEFSTSVIDMIENNSKGGGLITDEEKIRRYDRIFKGVKPKLHKGKHKSDWYTCGNCGKELLDGVRDNYCWNCGYSIKWDSCRCLTK